MIRCPSSRSLFLSALTCIALSACGGGGSGGGDRDRDAQPVLTSLSVSPAELTLEALGATAQLEATARDQNGNALSTQFTWGSSDTVVATVDADGLVTALNNGTATVTVRSGGVSASATVTVEQTPASVTVSSDEVVLTALEATEQLQASVFDANDRAMAAEVTWASSDAAVASVDEDGGITGHANGTATVTATVGSVSASVTVTVAQAVSSIDLAPETVTLAAIDQRAQFAASALDANGHPVDTDIAYTSSEPMVAEIDGTGVVIARRNGLSTITARSGTVSATAAVTVMQMLDRVTVVPDDMMFSAIGESARVQVMALDANGYPMNLAVSLSSSEPAVASVDSTGLVTARANGTTTVTATIGMLSDSVVVTVNQQAVSVSLAPTDTPTLDALGATVQLQAIAQDANGHTVDVAFDWTSADPAIAAVDANGLVTAQANGTTSVTATTGMLSDSVAVTVNQQVAGVSVAPPNIPTLDALGATVQFRAIAQDANGHTVDVAFDWTSADPAIAAVDANGLVTAQANGTTSVTATTGMLSDSVAVTVDQQVAGVSVAPPNIPTLDALGATVQFRAIAQDANGHTVDVAFDWTSADPAIAAVDANGLVTAQANGTTSVTATTGMLSDSVAVTVDQKVASVSLDLPDSDTLNAINATVQLQATAQDANGHTVNVEFDWTSSDPVVATVDANGLVTAQSNGTTTVTSTTGALSDSVAVTVNQQVASVRLVPLDSDPLDAIGATVQLQAIAQDANGHNVNVEFDWSSADPAIATVDATGLVTAQAHGTTTVTATAGALSDSIAVNVDQQVTGVSIAPPDADTFNAIGAAVQLRATAHDADGHNVAVEFDWASSDPSIATVDSTGLVTAQANGMATVTATIGMLSDSVVVTVNQQVANVSLTRLTTNSLDAIGATVQLRATARDANRHTVNVEFDWASSHPAIATVDENGLVTARSNGTATVTATAGMLSDSITLTVGQQVDSVILTPLYTDALEAVGATVQLRATAHDADGRNVTVEFDWASSDPTIASVDPAGLVTAHATGIVSVTATIRGQGRKVSASVAITVQVHTPPREPLTIRGDPNVRDSRTGRGPLHIAALANAPRLIEALVAAGADLEARDQDYMTPLHSATLANAPAAIAALLEAGADIEARNRFESTPLHFGLLRDSPAAVASLLEAGADPNARAENGSTALHYVRAPNPKIAHIRQIQSAMTMLSALLDAGADPNARNRSGFRRLCCNLSPVVVVPEGGETPLHDLAGFENPAIVRALLEAGADPNALDVSGHPPLSFWAGVGGNPQVLTALLEAGAKFQTRDIDGFVQLHIAAERDRPASVKALLGAGAVLNTRNNAGRTALHAAAASVELNQAAVSAAAAVAVLLEAGADPNARDNSGSTPLHLAPAGSRALMSALLDAHAGRTIQIPNARDAFGYTALHAVARANNPRLIAALLDAGADIDPLDNEGNTPLLLAAGSTRRVGLNVPPPSFSPAAITALAAAGADLEARDKRSLTALHRAASWGQTATIAALLEAGANPGALDDDERTPLLVALEGRAFDADGRAAIVTLAEAEAGIVGRYQSEFAAVVALAVGNPEALVHARVYLNARDHAGRTVLHWLPRWDDSVALPALSALLKAGVDLNARDKVGRTAVDWALWWGNPGMIAALASAGADLNVPVSGRTPLQQAIAWHVPVIVEALASAGADLELRDRNGWTALQAAAYEGAPSMIAALIRAGADLEARDDLGRTALQLAAIRDNPAPLYGGPSSPAAVAALVEAGANLDAYDNGGTTALNAAAVAGNQGAAGILLALGANWTSDPDAVPTEENARVVAVELFQGPMVWQWQSAESGAGEGIGVDHANTLLHRAATVAVRIGSENSDATPELSVSLSDDHGRAWATEAELVRNPRIVALASDSQSGLWETEYVYELPADWVDSGHRASFSIDLHNRLEETDESDNTATLTIGGHAVPVFDVTFVPIVFSGDTPAIDTDTYMAVLGDLLPIGQYQAQVGRPLDLSDRNLGTFDRELSRDTALSELLHRWNAEAGPNEYYHGLMSSADQSIVIGGIGVFGGVAILAGHVAVSDAIGETCQAEREFCGDGVLAHELGHNFGLVHLPDRCSGPGAVDHAFPYADAGIGPRRGWVTSRNEFVNPGTDNQYYDLMGYCAPRFVSDYNYNKMVSYRLGDIEAPTGDSERLGPSLEIGPNSSVALSMTTPSAPSLAYPSPAGATASSGGSGPGVAFTDEVDEIGPSLAFTGAVDEYGLWSTFRIDTSTQPSRPASGAGEYFFTLQDAFQREIYREPMKLLPTLHGETPRSWAVRVPVPEETPVSLVILDAQGTPLFIDPIDLPLEVRPL